MKNGSSPDPQRKDEGIVVEKGSPSTKTTMSKKKDPIESTFLQKHVPEMFPDESGPQPPTTNDGKLEDTKMKAIMTTTKQAIPLVEQGPDIVPQDPGPNLFIPLNDKSAAGQKQQIQGEKHDHIKKEATGQKQLHGKFAGHDLSLAPLLDVPPCPSELPLEPQQLHSMGVKDDSEAGVGSFIEELDNHNLTDNLTVPGAVQVTGVGSLAATSTTAASNHEDERSEVILEATLVDNARFDTLQANARTNSIYEAEIIPRQKRRRAAIVFCTAVLVLVAVAVGVTLAITTSPTPSPTFAPSTSWSPSYRPSNAPSFRPSLPPTTTVTPSAVPTFHAGFPAFSSIQSTSAVLSVALNENGNIVALGSIDFVTVYARGTLDNELWLPMGEPIFLQGEIGSGEFNRQMLDIASNGTVTVLALAKETQIDVYRFDTTEWVQEASLFQNLFNLSDYDGIALDLSSDGNSLAIAVTPSETLFGFTTVYEYSESGGWEMVGGSIPGYNDGYEKGLSLSSNGDFIAIGNPSEIGTGEARVYARTTELTSTSFNTTWDQIGGAIVGADYEDFFGRALSLSGGGNILAVGGPGFIGSSRSGEVRVYEYSDSTNTWLQLGSVLRDPAGEFAPSGFGEYVVLSSDGTTLLVGAYSSEQSTDVVCRLYEFNGNVWEKKGEDLSESGLPANYKLPVAFSTNVPYTLAIVSSGNATSLYHD